MRIPYPVSLFPRAGPEPAPVLSLYPSAEALNRQPALAQRAGKGICRTRAPGPAKKQRMPPQQRRDSHQTHRAHLLASTARQGEQWRSVRVPPRTAAGRADDGRLCHPMTQPNTRPTRPEGRPAGPNPLCMLHPWHQGVRLDASRGKNGPRQAGRRTIGWRGGSILPGPLRRRPAHAKCAWPQGITTTGHAPAGGRCTPPRHRVAPPATPGAARGRRAPAGPRPAVRESVPE